MNAIISGFRRRSKDVDTHRVTGHTPRLLLAAACRRLQGSGLGEDVWHSCHWNGIAGLAGQFWGGVFLQFSDHSQRAPLVKSDTGKLKRRMGSGEGGRGRGQGGIAVASIRVALDDTLTCREWGGRQGVTFWLEASMDSGYRVVQRQRRLQGARGVGAACLWQVVNSLNALTDKLGSVRRPR